MGYACWVLQCRFVIGLNGIDLKCRFVIGKMQVYDRIGKRAIHWQVAYSYSVCCIVGMQAKDKTNGGDETIKIGKLSWCLDKQSY